MARLYNIGNFTHPATFLRPVTEITETGERVKKYDTCFTRFCAIEDPLLKSATITDALAEEQTLVLKTWTVPKANTEWRVIVDGLIYDVVRVAEIDRNSSNYYIRRVDLCNE